MRSPHILEKERETRELNVSIMTLWDLQCQASFRCNGRGGKAAASSTAQSGGGARSSAIHICILSPDMSVIMLEISNLRGIGPPPRLLLPLFILLAQRIPFLLMLYLEISHSLASNATISALPRNATQSANPRISHMHLRLWKEAIYDKRVRQATEKGLSVGRRQRGGKSHLSCFAPALSSSRRRATKELMEVAATAHDPSLRCPSMARPPWSRALGPAWSI